MNNSSSASKRIIFSNILNNNNNLKKSNNNNNNSNIKPSVNATNFNSTNLASTNMMSTNLGTINIYSNNNNNFNYHNSTLANSNSQQKKLKTFCEKKLILDFETEKLNTSKDSINGKNYNKNCNKNKKFMTIEKYISTNNSISDYKKKKNGLFNFICCCKPMEN
jgi:hypothetical protein